MCGLAGYVDFSGEKDISILQMLDSIKHRGPDALGTRQFNSGEVKVALGHVRLSIIDVTSGADQPQSDLSDRYHIVYNGEVYNYNEIREQLSHKYDFRTNSDTEVILYSFIEWGTKCVEKFIGMFSIVIFDNVDCKLFLFNDRLGVKPLYYYFDENIFIFASELKAIMNYKGFDKVINRSAVTQFMQYGYIQPPLSIFEKVSKIEPGTVIEYCMGTRSLQQIRYWDILDRLRKRNEVGSNLSELENYIKVACELRLASDVPICSFLSGGIDSSLVTAIIAENGPINTISLGVDDTRYDEAGYARQVATSIGSTHSETYIQEKEIKSIMIELNNYFDEPFSDTSMYPTYLLSKFASDRFKVALSSDGGDEAFCGYQRYIFFKRYYWIYKIPLSLRKVISCLINYVSAKKLLFFQMPSISLKLTKLNNVLGAKNEADVYRMLNTYISDERAFEIIQRASIEPGYYKELDNLLSEKKINRLQVAMMIDYKTYVYQLLTKVDRSSMATSLEVREPLLDHNLIEFCAGLDIKEKISGNTTKIAPRRILGKYLRPEKIMREKRGFSVPIDDWLKNDLRELVDNLTSESEIEKSAVFRFEEVSKIKNNFYETGTNYIELWHIVVFQLWYQRWCC